MRNIRKFYITIFVVVIICYACASEIKPAEDNNDEDGIKLRLRRHSKKTESTSESVKKQKQQQQQDDNEAITRSQLTYTINTPNGLATIQSNVEPMRNVLQNIPLQMRQMDNPFNVVGMNNYALNYPYQGYPPQTLSPMGNQGYLYGNPNIHPLDQATNNNFISQQPIPDFANGQQSFPGNYAPNFMGYGSGQPGLNQPGQLPFPPAYGNNLMGYSPYPLGQPGIQNNFGVNGQQFTKPITNPGFNNIFGPQGGLAGMPPVNGNNFMGIGGLPGDATSAGQLAQLPQMPQPSILNPLVGMMPFGPAAQNGFVAPGGIFPEFIRNQRSLEDSQKE